MSVIYHTISLKTYRKRDAVNPAFGPAETVSAGDCEGLRNGEERDDVAGDVPAGEGQAPVRFLRHGMAGRTGELHHPA